MDTVLALRQEALALGARKAEVVEVRDIVTDASFRALCEANSCGNYGRNYTCPPYAGPIDELMRRLRGYGRALVWQTVSPLEDSFDFEGMLEAGRIHNRLARKLWDLTDGWGVEALHLGAGGCRLCEKCAAVTGEPCRNPKRAMASLETYGVNVSKLAGLAGMRYINGQNTVTYFGAVFFKHTPT